MAEFLVIWNQTDSDIRRLYLSFEYRGFLCKHALLVLQMSGVSNIPSQYVLKRWTKDAKITQFVAEVTNGFFYRVHHFNELCKRAIRLGEAGSLWEEAYHIAFQALEQVLESCVGVNNSNRSILESNTLAAHGFLGIEEGKNTNMAKSSKTKKIYKKRKEQINSRAHTTGNCYVPPEDMHDMELSSTAPTLDSFYGSQNSMQGGA